MVEGCDCGGSGIVEKDGKLYECVCALLKRRAASMPPFIRTASLQLGHTSHKLQDQIKKSLFILVTWPDMKAVIKAVMIRHMNLFVRITSDNDILHAYVGAMSKKNKGDNEATFETVGDFVGPPDLVVIRLNALTRPNKAAAGALEEAMVCRMDQDKPTWFVSDMDRPFTSSSPAYSESIWDLMEACAKIRVPPVLPRNLPTGMFDLEPVDSGSEPIVQKSEPKKAVKKRPKPDPVSNVDQEEDDSGLGMYGQGVGKSKGFGRGVD
jgi:hypothetical protein